MEKVLFTGARSGIAKSVIDILKDKDYYIYATVHNEKQAETMSRIYKDIPNVECMVLDITKKGDRKKINLLDIDILVCNAAVNYGGSLTEMDINLVRDNFEVNVFSHLELIQEVLHCMIAKKKGKIIIISSLAGIYPIKFIGSYAATKSSLIMVARTLHKELRMLDRNVQVCLIEPGFYYTGFNQVMFENKYPNMNVDSYFKKEIEKIRRKETFIHYFLEKKKLNSIVNKIVSAVEDETGRFLYRAPFLQVVFVKLYSLFKE